MAGAAWKIDSERSRIDFEVRYMAFQRVSGAFKRFRGEIRLDEEDATRSTVEVRIDARSIQTDRSDRDEELRRSFLAVDQHPEIIFRSRRVERTSGGKLRVHGDLQLRGVSGDVLLETTPKERQNGTAHFVAKATVDRTHYGSRWSSALDSHPVFIGRDVHIFIDVQAERTNESLK
ncbi:YceI family protein [Pendulispora albinea]|uniref:YceI family protein n=1 Tax=Pendulispora albinea TaxID=2741071 RepID=A0ABZ2MBR1_9BACT